MTRPDIEALVRDYYGNPLAEPFKPFGAVDLAHTVAAHERARIVADIRARAGRAAKMDRHGTEHLLAELADEMEADK